MRGASTGQGAVMDTVTSVRAVSHPARSPSFALFELLNLARGWVGRTGLSTQNENGARAEAPVCEDAIGGITPAPESTEGGGGG